VCHIYCLLRNYLLLGSPAYESAVSCLYTNLQSFWQPETQKTMKTATSADELRHIRNPGNVLR